MLLLFYGYCLFLPIPLSAKGQDHPEIKIKLVNQPAAKAFEIIEKQAKLTFHFDKTEIDPNSIVTLRFDHAPLTTVLEAISNQTGWTFQQRGIKSSSWERRKPRNRRSWP